jgi:hypothetical protein
VLVEEDTVIRFSDLICGQLIKRNLPTETPAIRQQLTWEDGVSNQIKIDGKTTQALTEEHMKQGKTASRDPTHKARRCEVRTYLDDLV